MLLLILGVLTMLASQAGAVQGGNGKGKGKPPGNNGTVKTDGVMLGPGKGNEPHVGCEFAVEFSNFDQGGDLNATVTFTLKAPTLRPDVKKDGQVLLTDTVFIGEDPAGGGDDLDASKLYQLDFDGVEPHPIQGYHVKLTVNAPGSQGADTKHKVFWTSCETPTTTTTEPPTTTTTEPPTTTTTEAPTTTTTEGAPPVVEGVTVTVPPTVPPQVLGAVETLPATLPRTGSGTANLLFLAGLSLALGGLTLLAGGTGRPSRAIPSV